MGASSIVVGTRPMGSILLCFLEFLFLILFWLIPWEIAFFWRNLSAVVMDLLFKRLEKWNLNLLQFLQCSRLIHIHKEENWVNFHLTWLSLSSLWSHFLVLSGRLLMASCWINMTRTDWWLVRVESPHKTTTKLPTYFLYNHESLIR